MIRLADIVKTFPKASMPAVNSVSFSMNDGERYGLVGESGSGKSTIARLILALDQPTAGQVTFNEKDISSLRGHALRNYRRKVQAVFQDPDDSLSPRLRVRDIVGEPLRVHRLARGKQLCARVGELLEAVGLPPEAADRFPHQFSGGQRQRIAIARAISLDPEFLVLDEAVSALDVSIQCQILNLLKDLQEQKGLGYLFISHNLAVVEYMCQRVGVLYAGCLVEEAPRHQIFSDPQHPYTSSLLSAVPGSGRLLERTGSIFREPARQGCRFHPRCEQVMPICKEHLPPLLIVNPDHRVACHLYNQKGGTSQSSPA